MRVKGEGVKGERSKPFPADDRFVALPGIITAGDMP